MKRAAAVILCIAALGMMSAVKSAEDNRAEKQEGSSERELAEVSAVSVKETFAVHAVDSGVLERIQGISYPEYALIGTEELRYLNVMYYGFDGKAHEGELIVNQSIAEDIISIFRELYKIKYPIEEMKLIDEYGADDERSMSSNNTSAFNYRTIAGTDRLSNHGKGLAIDINPLYNPCVQEKDGETLYEPAAGREYADRTKEIPYKIEKGDPCCQIFEKYGFIWGGDWDSPKDYQHFERPE